MRIIVDIMGGDHAPRAILEGVRDAAADCSAAFTLVGDREEALRFCEKEGLRSDRFEIIHSASIVTMEDDPLTAFRRKKDSSMMLGLKLLSEGAGDAFVSAGNTGALFTGASLLVKRIPGVDRAAIGTLLPGQSPFLLLDAGANLSVTPEYLEQFAVMGSAYMKHMYRIGNPTVGLLNNGTEDCKGTPLQIETNRRLKECPKIRYIGNVEGSAALSGACDVLVTDGFSGNIFLKTMEGSCRLLMKSLKQAYAKTARNRFSALLFRRSLSELKMRFDPSEYGGSPILGISKPVVKAHGASDKKAIRSAILQTADYLESGAEKEILYTFSD